MTKSIAISVGMVCIALGFVILFVTVDVIASSVVPLLNKMSLAEAQWYCELNETDPRWAYDGGYGDCVAWHTSGLKVLASRSLILLMGLVATAKFLAGGFLILYYVDETEEKA